MGGLLTAPGKLSLAARQNLRESVEREHAGVERSHRMLILEEGLSYTATSVPPEDAQFLQTKVHNIVEIARWLNMPPTMLAVAHEGGSMTYRNSTEEAQRLIDTCLLPWGVAWEQELNRKLIPLAERPRSYFAHNFSGLVRGDLTTRYAAFRTGIEGGWLSPNDIRRFDDMNPISAADGGDVYGRPGSPAPANGAGPGRDSASLVAARRLLEDAVKRSLAREGDRAKKSSRSIADLQSWADGFYSPSEAAGLAAQLEQVLASVSSVKHPADLARTLAARWHDQSRHDLGELARTAPLDVKAAVHTLVDAWAQHRPRAVADAVFAHLGS
jgi:hypothetical protein